MAKTPYARTDRELINQIGRSAGQRAGYKQLVRELGLGGGRERRLLLEQLARMTARKELVKIEDEMWALPNAVPERTARVRRAADEVATKATRGGEGFRELRDRLVAGRLDLHRDGYGFVRPNGSTTREDDLFHSAERAERRDAGGRGAGGRGATGPGWKEVGPGGAGADAAKPDGGGNLSLCEAAPEAGERVGGRRPGEGKLRDAAG